MEIKELILTQHSKERYAERIMNRDNKSDIAVFISQNESKIQEDIQKMIEYGEEIYFGVVKGKNQVHVVLNRTWVLFLDKDQKTVVTLYKIDFGLGEGFNQEFVIKMKSKLEAACEHCKEVSTEVAQKKEEYKLTVAESTEQIAEFRKGIKNLETQVSAYNDLINSVNIEQVAAEETVRSTVMEMICKKEF